MLNLLTSSQMRAADAHTVRLGTASIDLMEAACEAFIQLFQEEFPDKQSRLAVYCGTGNNGGDGLAIARLLYQAGYRQMSVKVLRFSEKPPTADFSANLGRLRGLRPVITELRESDPLPFEDATLIIDAILGSGLNKPLGGSLREAVLHLNALKRTIVSVDVPSGFKAEGPIAADHVAIEADLCISFQRPKINFLLPESARFVKRFEVVDIGLDENYIESLGGPYRILMEEDIAARLRQRGPFSHKGTFGHALIIAGEASTMGAALLCASACMHSGAGLTTACIPSEGLTALNSRTPEVMAVVREKGKPLEGVSWQKYQSVAIGPGLGTGSGSRELLEEVLREYRKPLVFDADAINLISMHYELMQLVPEHSIFTPHVKEFDRLFGEHYNWWDRLEAGIDRATTLGCTIVLKNRYTMIFTPDGLCLFNPTGAPSMAIGGMGDVLTGMIASFLAQGYRPQDAAILGTYLHGAAGESSDEYVVSPSALISNLPKTIQKHALNH